MTSDIWTLIEDAPANCKGVAELYDWSTNYDSNEGPFTLLLDLIGWSEDNVGETLYRGNLGYVEAAKLADALKEWANMPSAVEQFIDNLLNAEIAE